MKKLDWFLMALTFSAAWGLDRITKLWSVGTQSQHIYKWLVLKVHYNPGAILGLFSDLPPILRVVTLSTGGAFLIFTFFVIQYLLPIRALSLRYGMCLLLGGILGNVADRIAWGHVVDFIIFRYDNWGSPIFNLADAIQWLGHGMILVSLIRHAEKLWPETNTRKSYWVNLKFQIKYCFILMLVGFGIGVIGGTFAYTYLRVTILDLMGPNAEPALHRFLTPFIISFSALSAFFVLVLFLVGQMISHRVAGPVFAVEKLLGDFISRKYRPFKLRQSDEFQDIAIVVNQLREHLQENLPGTNIPTPVVPEEEVHSA